LTQSCAAVIHLLGALVKLLLEHPDQVVLLLQSLVRLVFRLFLHGCCLLKATVDNVQLLQDIVVVVCDSLRKRHKFIVSLDVELLLMIHFPGKLVDFLLHVFDPVFAYVHLALGLSRHISNEYLRFDDLVIDQVKDFGLFFGDACQVL
jgi:hypothetical protein